MMSDRGVVRKVVRPVPLPLSSRVSVTRGRGGEGHLIEGADVSSHAGRGGGGVRKG